MRAGPWENGAWSPSLIGNAVAPHMSQNHSRGSMINTLFVGMNVHKSDRPDVGYNHDMIYTASGKPKIGSPEATSISIADHQSTRDTFLIGPVAGGEKAGK